MIKSFKEYLKQGELSEASKVVAFTFGRLSPPTIGHEKLIDAVRKANPKDYRIYVSKSVDKKKNPLDFTAKIKFIKDMFPKHRKAIRDDGDVRMVFDILMKLQNEGVSDIIMVVGSDRVSEFETTITKYNGVEARHGLYDFNSIKVISAGDRDPDADDVSGMSASKMRASAADDDFETFSKGLPSGYNGKDLFDAVRKGMGL